MTKLDIICPIYFVDHELFEGNLKSWIKEIPHNKIYIGVNRKEEFEFVKEVCSKYKQIIVFKQFGKATLGGCLAELINKVKTEWYCYIHSDVQITPWAFEVLKRYMTEDVGIIESHREHWSGEFYEVGHDDGSKEWVPKNYFSDYYYRDRSFSGLQLIRKDAIMSLVDRLEDDYLYRNEDIIFQAECLKNGYKYAKTWAMHIHQNINTQWTFDKHSAYIMQFRGIVKYTLPSKTTKRACLSAIRILKKRFKTKLDSILIFCYEHNSNWCECIVERWDEL